MGLLGTGDHVVLPVQWPMLYANDDLVGQGTVLSISPVECRVAGTMPVTLGMRLKAWISPSNRHDALYVKTARVLWARNNEFWLEVVDLDVKDREWLRSYLQEG